MKKLLVIFFYGALAFCCASFLATCAKEYSYEGGPKLQTAEYTLEGAGDTCVSRVISGNYYAAVPLNNSNTVQLKANVTKEGSYNLSTKTTDGFYFSGSGNFTSTGLQNVLLKGNGTPTNSGTFNFSIPGTFGCSFNIAVDKTPPDTASFSLSGAPNDCTIFLPAGDFIMGSSVNNSSVTISVDVIKTGDYVISTDTLDNIYFSASGRFTKTGVQNVTLTGNGIPTEALNLLFTPSSSFSACKFKLSILPPGSLATYVIESNFGTPNPCTYQVSGSYVQGTSLPSSNTVRISVTAISLGSFAIATETVNGMRFYYSGTFTTTGTQYVFLKGSGTPINKGTFSFSPTIVGPAPLGGQACAFDITVQ